MFVIAPEPGSASLIMAQALESAACYEYTYLEFRLLLLRELTNVAPPLMRLHCFCLTFKQFI